LEIPLIFLFNLNPKLLNSFLFDNPHVFKSIEHLFKASLKEFELNDLLLLLFSNIFEKLLFKFLLA
jgi:hypothetical protein